MTEANTSPIPVQSNPVEKADLKHLSFTEAIQRILDGQKVTRLDWGDNETYCLLNDTYLSIHNSGEPSTTIHKWIVSDGDLFGTDWVVI